jgi:hypothetical protein
MNEQEEIIRLKQQITDRNRTADTPKRANTALHLSFLFYENKKDKCRQLFLNQKNKQNHLNKLLVLK